MEDEETIEESRAPLARERGADLAAFYDRRAAAALAYCARLCEPDAIADAVEAAFARVFEAAAGDADEASLDRHLRAAVRAEAAARAPDGGEYSQRIREAEQAFEALAGDDAPALGRSLLAEMIADAPLSEPPAWLEDLDWGLTAERGPRSAVPEVVSADTEEFDALAPDEPTRKPRRRLALALLIIGTLLVAEAATTVLWKEPVTAYLASRSQDELGDQLEKLDGKQEIPSADAERLASIRDVDERGEKRMALLARRERDSVPTGDALGLLRMGSIDAEYVVVQGTDSASLRTGPAHYRDTALPGEGAVVGIAGHRTTYEGPFRNIDDLERGDKITMKMPYGLFTYSVDRRRIVPADFKSAFAEEGDWLVLSACHPLYSASERILVYARLVDAEPRGAAVEDEAAEPTERELALRRRERRLERMGDRTLVAGMTGSDVKEVQRMLGLPKTGTFGPETSAAVLEFQRTHGLPVVGQVGSQTKAALARRPRPPSRPPTPPPVAQQTPPEQEQAPYGQQPTDQYGQQPGYVPPAQQPGYTPTQP